MFQRPYFQELAARLREPRRFIQVVMGPRQVGKSTLIGQILQEVDILHLLVSADAVANASDLWVEQQWEAAGLQLKNSGSTDWHRAGDEIGSFGSRRICTDCSSIDLHGKVGYVVVCG